MKMKKNKIEVKEKIGKFVRKGFWISEENARNIEKESVKKNQSESALVRDMITHKFKK